MLVTGVVGKFVEWPRSAPDCGGQRDGRAMEIREAQVCRIERSPSHAESSCHTRKRWHVKVDQSAVATRPIRSLFQRDRRDPGNRRGCECTEEDSTRRRWPRSASRRLEGRGLCVQPQPPRRTPVHRRGPRRCRRAVHRKPPRPAAVGLGGALRSFASLVACGPAASSAMVIELTAISTGSNNGSSCSKSITTEVSIIPRTGRRSCSATWNRLLGRHPV